MHGLSAPRQTHTGSASRIHSTPLANPAITKSAMDGSSGDPSTTSGPQPNTLGPELLIRGGDTQGRPPLGGPAAFPSEGGSGRSLSDSGGYGKRGVRRADAGGDPDTLTQPLLNLLQPFSVPANLPRFYF